MLQIWLITDSSILQRVVMGLTTETLSEMTNEQQQVVITTSVTMTVSTQPITSQSQDTTGSASTSGVYVSTAGSGAVSTDYKGDDKDDDEDDDKDDYYDEDDDPNEDELFYRQPRQDFGL